MNKLQKLARLIQYDLAHGGLLIILFALISLVIIMILWGLI